MIVYQCIGDSLYSDNVPVMMYQVVYHNNKYLIGVVPRDYLLKPGDHFKLANFKTCTLHSCHFAIFLLRHSKLLSGNVRLSKIPHFFKPKIFDLTFPRKCGQKYFFKDEKNLKK